MAYVVTINQFRHEVREKVAVGVDAQGRKKYQGKLVKSFPQRVEADAFVANFRLKNSVGERVKASQGKIPMEDALRAYTHEQQQENGWDDKEPAMYRLRAFLRQDLEWLTRKDLGAIDYEDMDAYIEQRDDDDIAASTINRELNVLSPFFNWAKKQYKIKHWENPVANCDRPKYDDKRDRTLSQAEYNAVLNACNKSGSEMLVYAFILAYETALRRNELCNVKWSDVVLDGANSHINVRKDTTKTKQARTVPLSKLAQETMAEIQAWQAVRKEREDVLRKRRENKSDVYDMDYVLSGVKSRAIGQAFKRAMESSGVLDFRFHDCRHCATTKLAETFEMLELSQITGHADPRMLKRYYNPHGARLAQKLNA